MSFILKCVKCTNLRNDDESSDHGNDHNSLSRTDRFFNLSLTILIKRKRFFFLSDETFSFNDKRNSHNSSKNRLSSIDKQEFQHLNKEKQQMLTIEKTTNLERNTTREDQRMSTSILSWKNLRLSIRNIDTETSRLFFFEKKKDKKSQRNIELLFEKLDSKPLSQKQHHRH